MAKAFRLRGRTVNFDLSFEERVEMQKRLSARGFETGGADGRFGARTYEAVLGFQHKVGYGHGRHAFAQGA